MEASATLESEPATRTQPAPRPPHWSRHLVRAVVIIAFVGMIAVAAKPVRDRFVVKRFSEVIPGEVYRSGQISHWLIEDTLTKHGIKTIVDLQGRDLRDVNQNHEVSVAQALGVTVHRFQLRGNGTGDINHYADAVETIHNCRQAGTPVLVHCAAGTMRTGGVVASYELFVEGRSREEILAELKAHNWKEHQTELTDYLNENLPQLAQMLVERGVIDRVPDKIPTF